MATGTRARGGGGKFTRTADSIRRDHRAAELHGQGWSYRRIADELGFASGGKAHEAVLRAFAEIPSEGTEQARLLDLDRIDRLVEKAWEVMLRDHLTVSQGRVVGKRVDWEREADGSILRDGDGEPVGLYEDILDDGPALAAIREIRALLERRAKIYGYDAPARSRVEVITAEMIESHIAELEAQVGPDDPANPGPA
jgi:hypothetical protein